MEMPELLRYLCVLRTPIREACACAISSSTKMLGMLLVACHRKQHLFLRSGYGVLPLELGEGSPESHRQNPLAQGKQVSERSAIAGAWSHSIGEVEVQKEN